MLSEIFRFFSGVFNAVDDRNYPIDKSKPHWENKNPYRYGEEDWVWVEPQVEEKKYYVAVCEGKEEDSVIIKIMPKLPKSYVDYMECNGKMELKMTLVCIYAQYTMDYKVKLIYDTKEIPNMVVKEKELIFLN